MLVRLVVLGVRGVVRGGVRRGFEVEMVRSLVGLYIDGIVNGRVTVRRLCMAEYEE